MKNIFVMLAASAFVVTNASADCVYSAKGKTTYEIVDSHTVHFTGGNTRDFIFKTYSDIKPDAKIVVLKNYFCSFEPAVLNVDGEIVDSKLVIKQRY